MQLESSALEGGGVRVRLLGALDIAGAQAVDLEFSRIAGSEDRVLVDFSGVDFLASIGIRTLVVTARTVTRRGGKMVIVGPQPNVLAVLQSAGVSEMVPVYEHESEALASLTPGA